MRVITFTENELQCEVNLLFQKVRCSGFTPNIIVGIRTGGEHVARMGISEFPGAKMLILEKKRKSTKLKRKTKISLLLRRFPYFVTDRLRILEHRVRERELRQLGGDRTHSPEHTEVVPVTSGDVPTDHMKILVVDDAVDTGRTMAAVVRYLQKEYLNSEIRTLAIAKTMHGPEIEPDYIRTGYGTLIRFYWSEDFHGPR